MRWKSLQCGVWLVLAALTPVHVLAGSGDSLSDAYICTNFTVGGRLDADGNKASSSADRVAIRDSCYLHSYLISYAHSIVQLRAGTLPTLR
ncbi:hypothetical protein K431DRAFT_150151 [Polychaeton citri CBS 116435]|uniref:Uncharacterized protein n=1 Tax=Polychaeton citri CBS 116435 TaxID=1314669 RepID=A0A9P4UJ89_9PEZI|nr:hypothetical protein K431DRAFT_150151 [Polychaeton citri CBS 116435]